MVRIPDIPVAQRRLPTTPAGVAPSIAQATAGGRGITEIGGALQREAVQQRKEEERQAEKTATVSIADFQLGQLQDFENLKIEHDDVETFTETFQTNFDTNAGELLSQTEGLTQDRLGEKLDNLKFNLTRNAITFQAKQKIALKKQQSDAAINTYANLISQNPDSFEDVLASLEDTFDASKQFMTRSDHEEFKNEALAEIGEAKVRAEILRDTDGAESLLKNKEIATVLDSDTMRILNKELLQQKKKNIDEDIKTISAERARAAIDTGVPIDGRDKNNQKAIDGLFEVGAIGEDLSNLDVSAANELTMIAQRTNYLPKEGESILRSFLATGSNEQKQFATDTIARLQEQAPNTLLGFNRNEISEALLATKYLRAGVSLDNAFTFASEQVDPLNKDVIGLRKTVSNEQLKDLNVAGRIEDAFETFFVFEPDIPDAPRLRDAMTSEYKTIWEGFFLNTGDTDVADQLTEAEIQRFYGKTNVTGDTLVMKYPPENFYHVDGLDDSWIQKQFTKDVVEATGNKEIDMDDVFLLPDSRTAREAKTGGSPSYLVLITQEDGSVKELRDDGGDLLRQVFDSSDAENRANEKLASTRMRRKQLTDAIRKGRQINKELRREGFGILSPTGRGF